MLLVRIEKSRKLTSRTRLPEEESAMLLNAIHNKESVSPYMFPTRGVSTKPLRLLSMVDEN